VVVAVGLTLVEPLAKADVNAPGVIAMPVAPVVVQFKVLLLPDVMFEGVAANELIVGLLPVPEVTVTVAVEVTDPAELVAVNV
jgi:hypothetical protein